MTESAPSTLAGDAPVLDLFAPDFAPDSAETLAAQEKSWYAATSVGVAVLRYEQAQKLLRDPRLWQSTTVFHAMQGVTAGPFVDWWADTLLGAEGDHHARLHRLVAPAFRPARMEAMRSMARRAIEGLVERVADRGEVDVVAELTDLYPTLVLSELLQVPESVGAQARGWTATFTLGFGLQVAEHIDAVNDAAVNLGALMDELIAHRRAHPVEGLVSDLISAEAEGDRLSHPELRAMLMGLLFSGHDTVRNQLASGLLLFAQHPDQWELLARRPELASLAVEEILRLIPCVPVISRTPREDMEFEGVPLPVGSFVAVLIPTAHRDPLVYGPDAGFRVDVPRPATLAFGAGIHSCLGVSLARVELHEALLALTRRFEAPVPAGPVQWRAPGGIFGPNRLPVVLTPRPAAG
ncbi:MAG TPA: cytochrome P450 [Mycobacteriales bacterium]|nr:cytochrome P450 [Mycobacteriales bacterium]